jgi:hypothetical protein
VRLHFTHGAIISLVYMKLLKADVWALYSRIATGALEHSGSVNKVELNGRKRQVFSKCLVHY